MGRVMEMSRVAEPGRVPAAQRPGAEHAVPFHRASITEDDIDAVTAVLRSGWLTTGARVKEFEAALAAAVGARHAVALNSGTAALHLALEALGVGPGDEVIAPAYTFTATAEVVTYLGATPVLADVDRRSLNITAEEIARRATWRTRAVMLVHVAGASWEAAEVLATAAERGIAVVEDAAHALPTLIGASHAGTLGAAGMYSFYATKTLTTGEGGMLVTDDDAIARRARSMALHGITSDAYDRYAAAGRWEYEVGDFGFKYNMTDLAAALGLSQLARLRDMRDARAAVAARYDTAFSGLAALELPHRGGGDADSWHLYILRVHPERLDCDRDRVIDELGALGIGTSVHFIPLHLHPAYQRHLGARPGDHPVAEAEFRRAVSLPIWPDMTETDVDAVIAAVTGVVTRHARR